MTIPHDEAMNVTYLIDNLGLPFGDTTYLEALFTLDWESDSRLRDLGHGRFKEEEILVPVFHLVGMSAEGDDTYEEFDRRRTIELIGKDEVRKLEREMENNYEYENYEPYL